MAALVALRVFRFPLLALVAVATSWFFSRWTCCRAGGNWSATITFLARGSVPRCCGDARHGRAPPVFCFLAARGLWSCVRRSLVYFLHDGDFDWALIGLAGLLYIALAAPLDRSSWAVLGAIGILLSAAHYSEVPPPFVTLPFVGLDTGSKGLRGPIVFALAGLLLMLLGGLLACCCRRARERAAAA